MFPVRYELNFYILHRRNSVFKGLKRTWKQRSQRKLHSPKEKMVMSTGTDILVVVSSSLINDPKDWIQCATCEE
jgi:hypothetical protein